MALLKQIPCWCCGRPATKKRFAERARCDRCYIMGCQATQRGCKNLLAPGESKTVAVGICKCCATEITIIQGDRHKWHVGNSRRQYRKWCDRCKNLRCSEYMYRGTEPLCKTNREPQRYQKRGINRQPTLPA